MKHTQTLGVFSYETIGFYYERIATNAAGGVRGRSEGPSKSG